MPKFSERSKKNLAECDPKLQQVFNLVITKVDCSILCGHRNKVLQDQSVKDGSSKLAWPKSKHNSTPSKAVDVVPYPLNWQNIDEFRMFGEFVKGVALGLGVELVWGGDWNQFKDYPHWELKS